jgi:enoyl-CoA hydratase/carnithine racemase
MRDLLYERKNHVATLKLNRPARMNAISFEMLSSLGDALEEIDRDPEIRVIIVTGEGRGFCSGLDMKDAAAGKGIGGSGTLSGAGGASHLSTREIPTVTLNRIDVPVLCAINGAAAGYGLDLALGCDIRLMSDRARLLPGFAKRGIIPESGGTWYLPRLVGWARACEIGFLGEEILPERALELGLVNRVVRHEDLMAEAWDWAERISANAPLGVRAMKRLYRHGLTEDFESHSHHVLMQLLLLFRSEDFQEGIRSFIEKREPKFSGR